MNRIVTGCVVAMVVAAMLPAAARADGLPNTLTFDLSSVTATYGDDDIDISALASGQSSSPITFASNTPTVCQTGRRIWRHGRDPRRGRVLHHGLAGGDGSYEAATPMLDTFTVARAGADCTVTGYSVTYDGVPTPPAAAARASAAPSSAASTSPAPATPSPARTPATPGRSPTRTGNYNPAAGTVDDSIAKAEPSCTVTGYSVTYDASAHTASGSCTGVGGVVLAGLDLSGTTHTNAGPYAADTWSFTDVTGNYLDAAGARRRRHRDRPGPPARSPATPSPTTDRRTPPSATCPGVGGAVLSGLDLSGTSHTNAGPTPTTPGRSPTRPATTTRRPAPSTTRSQRPSRPARSPATRHLRRNAAHRRRNVHRRRRRRPQRPRPLAARATRTPAHTPTTPGRSPTRTATTTRRPARVDDTIAKAEPSCTVTGYSVTYDGTPHTATGTCTGVGGVVLAGLDLSGTTHTQPARYPDDPWTFTDPTGNYSGTDGTVSDSIGLAGATLTFDLRRQRDVRRRRPSTSASLASGASSSPITFASQHPVDVPRSARQHGRIRGAGRLLHHGLAGGGREPSGGRRRHQHVHRRPGGRRLHGHRLQRHLRRTAAHRHRQRARASAAPASAASTSPAPATRTPARTPATPGRSPTRTATTTGIRHRRRRDRKGRAILHGHRLQRHLRRECPHRQRQLHGRRRRHPRRPRPLRHDPHQSPARTPPTPGRSPTSPATTSTPRGRSATPSLRRA